jgi:hypothetical protein
VNSITIFYRLLLSIPHNAFSVHFFIFLGKCFFVISNNSSVLKKVLQQLIIGWRTTCILSWFKSDPKNSIKKSRHVVRANYMYQHYSKLYIIAFGGLMQRTKYWYCLTNLTFVDKSVCFFSKKILLPLFMQPKPYLNLSLFSFMLSNFIPFTRNNFFGKRKTITGNPTFRFAIIIIWTDCCLLGDSILNFGF